VVGTPTVDYSGGAYTIFATVMLPGNSTSQNTVWQAGPLSNGQIGPHLTGGQNIQSTLNLNLLSGSGVGASNSRLHRRNVSPPPPIFLVLLLKNNSEHQGNNILCLFNA
jgi:hypothetical protein